MIARHSNKREKDQILELAWRPEKATAEIGVGLKSKEG
jgi:hypothetical protein